MANRDGKREVYPWLRSSSFYHAGRTARRAYEAYGEHAGWKTHDGRPMPAWAMLGDTVQGHWVAAIEAVIGNEPIDEDKAV